VALALAGALAVAVTTAVAAGRHHTDPAAPAPVTTRDPRAWQARAQRALGPRLRVAWLGAPALGVPRSPLLVYLPAGYGDPANAHRAYPVVYLLHGYPADQNGWFTPDGVPAALGAPGVGPMIVVAPNVNADPGHAHDTECLDAVRGPKLETYVARTVVAYVDRTYRTVASRSGRALGGMSSGGFCALNVGLRHQDEFSVLLAQQPYGDPGRGPGRRLLGGAPALVLANSPAGYLPTVALRRPLAVFMDAPDGDAEVRANQVLLARLFRARGVPVTTRIVEGSGHGWAAARAGLPAALAFAAAHLTLPG
jgi:S-formylglutathione hydrolase FrmB